PPPLGCSVQEVLSARRPCDGIRRRGGAHGGEAADAAQAYENAGTDERAALLRFLGTLEPTTSTLSAATDRSSLPGGYAASTPCGGEPSHASLAAARPLSSGGRSRAGRPPRRRPAGDRARMALPHGGRRRQRGGGPRRRRGALRRAHATPRVELPRDHPRPGALACRQGALRGARADRGA